MGSFLQLITLALGHVHSKSCSLRAVQTYTTSFSKCHAASVSAAEEDKARAEARQQEAAARANEVEASLARAERKAALLTKEREGLKAILASYDEEYLNHQGMKLLVIFWALIKILTSHLQEVQSASEKTSHTMQCLTHSPIHCHFSQPFTAAATACLAEFTAGLKLLACTFRWSDPAAADAHCRAGGDGGGPSCTHPIFRGGAASIQCAARTGVRVCASRC